MVLTALTSLLDFQLHLEAHPDRPRALAGYAFAVHRDSTTNTREEDIATRDVTNTRALRDIISAMYSPSATRWNPAHLVGNLYPAGYLVPVRGPLATDPVHIRFVIAASFVGTKAAYTPANPHHFVGFSGSNVFSRGDDLDGSSLADGTMSVSSFSYDDTSTAFSPTHFRSVPSLKVASRTKALKEAYPATFKAVTSSISPLLQSSTADDSHHGFWVDHGNAAQRVAIPAIFPIPCNTDFSICKDVPIFSSIISVDEKAAFAELLHDAGALNSSFLVSCPIFSLWVDGIRNFSDTFVPIATRMNEFSSLPFVEFQDAARASINLLIADSIDFEQQGNDVPLLAYKQTPSSLFQPANWDPNVQPKFSCSPLSMMGLKSVFAVTDMTNSVPGINPRHLSTPATTPQSFSHSGTTAHRSLFSNVLQGTSPGGNTQSQTPPPSTSPRLSSSQECIRNMGIIDFVSRKGFFPFTPATQDFDLVQVDTSAPQGVRTITNSSDFILAHLNPYAEIGDNSNRVNSVRDNFRQCQGEIGLVSHHCQRACSNISRFFCDSVFGKIFMGQLCQAPLDSHPFVGFSPVLLLLLFDDVSLVNGLPLLPFDGFPSFQMAEDFIGSILILLTYLWSYDHCQYTLLYQGYSHLLKTLQSSSLRVCWNNPNFAKVEYTLNILELAHNLWCASAKHACCMPTTYRQQLLLKSSNGTFSDVTSVPANVRSLQSSTTFSDIVTAWYNHTLVAFSTDRISGSTGILSPTFMRTAEYSHFLFANRHARPPAAPLPPVVKNQNDQSNFETPPPNKKQRIKDSPLQVKPKKPIAAPVSCHIIDPVSTNPDARNQIMSLNLPVPTGGFQPRRNAAGEFPFSRLCLKYLAGLECDGANACGYHLHVDTQSLKHTPAAYKPLRDFIHEHRASIKASPAALANPKLFPSA